MTQLSLPYTAKEYQQFVIDLKNKQINIDDIPIVKTFINDTVAGNFLDAKNKECFDNIFRQIETIEEKFANQDKDNFGYLFDISHKFAELNRTFFNIYYPITLRKWKIEVNRK